jgi:pyridoxamine 5'-phosphate oxidase
LNQKEMFRLMKGNPAVHLATMEGDQARVRCVFLYKADENGIIFHTGKTKDMYKHIEINPKVELCFTDLSNVYYLNTFSYLTLYLPKN